MAILVAIMMLMPTALAVPSEDPVSVDFTATPSVADPLSVTFKDVSEGTNSGYKVFWNFGDGTTADREDEVIHQYAAEGTYQVTMTLKHDSGQSQFGDLEATKAVTVTASDAPEENQPYADFSADKTSGDSPLTVSFTDKCENIEGLTTIWDFGDGTEKVYGPGDKVHTFQLPEGESYKSYDVVLSLWDAQGVSAGGSSMQIEVFAPEEQDPEIEEYHPVADFTVSPESGDMPLVVTLTDKSRNATGIEWLVEGNPVSTDAELQWTFLNQGIYNVTLVASNGTESDSMSKHIEVYYVAPNPEDVPSASFTATPKSGNAPLTVTLQSTSTNTDSVKWYMEGAYFSDDGINPVTLTFDEPGEYIISLEAFKGDNTNWAYETIVVDESAGGIQYLPVASFEANVTSGDAPLWVKLTDTSTNATGIEWWIDGDLLSLNPIFEYEFTEKGNHTVWLYASNESYVGRSEAVKYIQVNEAVQEEEEEEDDEGILPVANFTASATEGDAPLSVQFTSTSENANETFWTFARDGDEEGESRDEINPLFVFTIPGNYTVTIFVSNDDGVDFKDMRISVSQGSEIPVIDPPQPPIEDEVRAAFDNNVSTGFVPLSVEFTDMSANATAVRWYVNGDKVSEDSVMVYTFDEVGSYEVTLIASNGEVFDTATKTIIVKQQEGASGEDEDQTDDDDQAGDDAEPGDNDDNAEPEGDDEDMNPGDDDEVVTPEDNDDNAEPEGDDEVVIPEDNDDNAEPEGDDEVVTPEDNDDNAEPENDNDDASPEEVDDDVKPGDSDGESDDDQADKNKPDNDCDDSSDAIEPADDRKEDKCAPVKDECKQKKEDKCAPVKDECKEKKEDKCAPVKDECKEKKEDKCAPVKDECKEQKKDKPAPIKDKCKEQKLERKPVADEPVDDQKDVESAPAEDKCEDQKSEPVDAEPVDDQKEEFDPIEDECKPVDDEPVDEVGEEAEKEICDEQKEEENEPEPVEEEEIDVPAVSEEKVNSSC